jgi:hypothetical protein
MPGLALCCLLNTEVMAQMNLFKAETELRNAPSGLASTESLKILEAQQLDIGTNSRLLAQLATQSSYPFVAVSAITRLRKTDIDEAYVISLVRCWGTTNIGSLLMVPYLEVLTNKVSGEVFQAAVSVVGSSEPAKPENAVITVRQIERSQLMHWLLSYAPSQIPVTFEALAIDRFLGQASELEAGQLETFRSRLKGLVQFPGMPTAIYLLHSDQVPPNSASLIKNLAEDKNVDSTLKRMLFKKFANELRRSLDIDQLAVSEKEKERYRKWLSTDEAPK